MPTATLSFLLPDERVEHQYAIHGARFYSALHKVDERLRSLLKHDGICAFTSEQLAEEIRSMIASDLALLDE